MQRILAIAIKDFRLTLRDRAALLTMLATPLAVAMVLGFAFGGLGGSSGPSGIGTVVVNGDGGEAGNAIAAALTAPSVGDLLAVTTTADASAARAIVDADKAAAAVIIPGGLTAQVRGAAASSPPVVIEIYVSPSSPTGSAIVRSIVDAVLSRLAAAAAAAKVTAEGVAAVLPAGDARVAAAAQAGAAAAAAGPGIQIDERVGGAQGGNGNVNYGQIIGPSMAVMFLMFAVTSGGRRMLDERQGGTLARLISTPTTTAQILLGKGAGIYLAGAVQMAILLAVSTILFGIHWGSLPGLIILTAALVLAATGWGVLIAGLARTPAQVMQAGTAVSLLFGLAAGNLIPRDQLPEVMRTASLVTPNALGLEGYRSLAAGGGLEGIVLFTAVLGAMAVALFAFTAVASRDRLMAP